ncbi:MAG: hypothetical protein E7354_02490 [Clostridiales bacterium]|nr:hypothetical protein [Clostridiales bacterium]
MNLSYILQLKDFFILLILGFIAGILYGTLAIISTIKQKTWIRIITDTISTLIICFIFIIALTLVNMGEFRLFLLVGFLLGIFFERLTLGKIFAKGYKWVYNMLIILCKNLKKSRLGKVLFK